MAGSPLLPGNHSRQLAFIRFVAARLVHPCRKEACMEEQRIVESSPVRSRRGMPPFSWYVALPLLALTGLLIYWLVQIGAFIANHFGMWWAAHGGWVIAIGS